MNNGRFSSLTISIFLLAGIIVVGAMGFMIIEDYSFVNAFFIFSNPNF